ncbi:hypothetical protein T10_3527 [Trichinella papuae]|uniref:Uncharacterized protein n=1 Tax=Trichinella papuae TaxID=268474 RepID=A0A0V1M779_9BILA|nr:hypothetical protein T10_3527 [Trichinella papuae]
MLNKEREKTLLLGEEEEEKFQTRHKFYTSYTALVSGNLFMLFKFVKWKREKGTCKICASKKKKTTKGKSVHRQHVDMGRLAAEAQQS